MLVIGSIIKIFTSNIGNHLHQLSYVRHFNACSIFKEIMLCDGNLIQLKGSTKSKSLHSKSVGFLLWASSKKLGDWFEQLVIPIKCNNRWKASWISSQIWCNIPPTSKANSRVILMKRKRSYRLGSIHSSAMVIEYCTFGLTFIYRNIWRKICCSFERMQKLKKI